MAVNYIPICENETAEVIELPLEQDGTLLLSTLTGQFDSALGLKYRHPDSKAMRGIRLADGKLHPPTSDGWVDEAYICVFPKGKFYLFFIYKQLWYYNYLFYNRRK